MKGTHGTRQFLPPLLKVFFVCTFSMFCTGGILFLSGRTAMGHQGEQGAWQSRVEESLGQLWKGTLREVHTTLGRRRGGRASRGSSCSADGLVVHSATDADGWDVIERSCPSSQHRAEVSSSNPRVDDSPYVLGGDALMDEDDEYRRIWNLPPKHTTLQLPTSPREPRSSREHERMEAHGTDRVASESTSPRSIARQRSSSAPHADVSSDAVQSQRSSSGACVAGGVSAPSGESAAIDGHTSDGSNENDRRSDSNCGAAASRSTHAVAAAAALESTPRESARLESAPLEADNSDAPHSTAAPMVGVVQAAASVSLESDTSGSASASAVGCDPLRIDEGGGGAPEMLEMKLMPLGQQPLRPNRPVDSGIERREKRDGLRRGLLRGEGNVSQRLGLRASTQTRDARPLARRLVGCLWPSQLRLSQLRLSRLRLSQLRLNQQRLSRQCLSRQCLSRLLPIVVDLLKSRSPRPPQHKSARGRRRMAAVLPCCTP